MTDPAKPDSRDAPKRYTTPWDMIQATAAA